MLPRLPTTRGWELGDYFEEYDRRVWAAGAPDGGREALDGDDEDFRRFARLRLHRDSHDSLGAPAAADGKQEEEGGAAATATAATAATAGGAAVPPAAQHRPRRPQVSSGGGAAGSMAAASAVAAATDAALAAGTPPAAEVSPLKSAPGSARRRHGSFVAHGARAGAGTGTAAPSLAVPAAGLARTGSSSQLTPAGMGISPAKVRKPAARAGSRAGVLTD